MAFNHLEDYEIFLESLPSNNLDAFDLNSDKLLFNPYELYCDEQKMLPNDDYDPDTHYYNQTPHTKHSKYYNISEFNSVVSDNS